LFLGLWKDKNADLLGLDIGSDTIKLIDIDCTQSPMRLNNYAILPLPPGSIEKNEVKDIRAVSQIIKQLYQQFNTKTKEIAIAIPRSAVILKNTTVNSRLSSSEIESRVWLEANQNFPELIGGLYLDYQILGPSSEDSAQLDLLMIACRKDQINPYIDILRQSDLVPNVVDVNSYALERALSICAVDYTNLETTALINLDLALSSLVVVHKNELIYAHDYSYDGHRLIEQTKSYLDAEVKDASAYHNMLKENLIPHLLHAMHFFYSSRPHVSIQTLFLSGECVRLPDIANVVEKEIGIPSVVANPFTHMTLASHLKREEVTRVSPMLMLCCGLALYGNLCQK